jgi:hypothetical protein
MIVWNRKVTNIGVAFGSNLHGTEWPPILMSRHGTERLFCLITTQQKGS